MRWHECTVETKANSRDGEMTVYRAKDHPMPFYRCIYAFNFSGLIRPLSEMVQNQ